MKPLLLHVVVGFAFLAAACSGNLSEPGVGQQSQALEELVLDANFTATGGTSLICFVGSPNTWGEQFVPTQDNVAAASFHLSNLGPALDTSVDVRILDSSYVELGATTVPVSTTFDGEIVEVFAEFTPPVTVVPGTTYVLQGVLPPSTFDGGLTWLDGRVDPYPGGSAVSWCPDNDPMLIPDHDMDFATYALVEVPAPTLDELLDAVDPDPAAGQMTGPSAGANAGRLHAFQQMVDEAEALFAAGETAQGCAKLAAARAKLTGPHAWFAGETAAALLEALDALADANGCA